MRPAYAAIVPEFLSETWVEELDRAVRDSVSVSALAPIVIEQVVVDVPGRGEVRYRLRVDGDGARVTGGGERIIEPDLDISAAEGSAVHEVVGGSGLVTDRTLHQQPGLELVIQAHESIRRRVHAGGVGGH